MPDRFDEVRLRLGERPRTALGQQVAGEFHGGQRGAQFVADVGDELALDS